MPVDSDAAALGARIKSARTRKRMTLKVLSTRASLSESFLSQLERGLTQASISSVRRIAEALEIQVSDLFDTGATADSHLVRRADHPRIAFGDGATKTLLTAQRNLQNIEVLQANLVVGGSTGVNAYAHGDSEELLVVLSGQVKVEIGDEVHHLHHGDTLSYSSAQPHRLINAGDQPSELIWIVSPPSY
nr:cupin domain-containing protein [Jatrophihabitans sp. SB3-54]